MKNSPSQAICISRRSDICLWFYCCSVNAGVRFLRWFCKFTAKCSRIACTPLSCDLYFHKRSRIMASPLPAAQTIIKAVCNFADHACRLHHRESSCSLTNMADILREFYSWIALIISLTELTCSYSALSNGFDVGIA